MVVSPAPDDRFRPGQADSWLPLALRERLLLERSFGWEPLLGWSPRARAAQPAGTAAPAGEVPAGAAPRSSAVQSSASQSAAPPPAERERRQALLDALAAEVSPCRSCVLCERRTRTVFGTGDPCARLMFIGEAPGEDEDRQGEPFVGVAGQLLDRMIDAMGLGRSEVYIANIVKCRPPQNRKPEPGEIVSCLPYLERQIGIVSPEVICALGSVAARTLLDTQLSIGRLRGRFADYRGIPVLPTFHPAYLLRNPSDKRLCWEDLKKVCERLGRCPPPPPPRGGGNQKYSPPKSPA